MSIKSAFESEGIDFSQVMNPPEPWDGRVLIKNINGKALHARKRSDRRRP